MDKQKIFAQRAKKLAAVQAPKEEYKQKVEIIKFSIGREKLGLEIRFVKEVYNYKDLTTLPSVPDFILGLINVRRRIVSVLDIRPLLNLQAKERSTFGKALILEGKNLECGLDVDLIDGIGNYDAESIQPPLISLSGTQRRLIKGILGDSTVIIDGEMLSTDDAIKVDQKVI